MTTNFPTLMQGGSHLPAALRQEMQGMQSSEMQENVTPSFAVVSIKGKVFSVKHAGNTIPLTLTVNGQVFAAPYFDVVMPIANGALSKTWYKSGYVDGSEEAPDCWSEDGKVPIGPVENRPLDPRSGLPCTSCDLCPMNQFGSRISETGRKGKACSDTRKVIVLPCVPTGQKNPDGSDVVVMDHENIKYGGPMLLRVPAASLKVFAEYDSKLSSLGLSYFTVVTRMAFDTTEAFPKFVLNPIRVLSDDEAAHVVALRSDPHVAKILMNPQANTPQAALPGPDMSHLLGQSAPAALAQQIAAPAAPSPIPVPPAPTAAPVPVSNVVPMQLPPQPAPAPAPAPAPVMTAPAPAPVMAAPTPLPLPLPPAPPAPAPVAPAAFPPPGWTAHPTAPGYFYAGQEVLSEADLRARAAQQVQGVAAAAAAQPPVVGNTPALVQVTPGTFNAVDALLGN